MSFWPSTSRSGCLSGPVSELHPFQLSQLDGLALHVVVDIDVGLSRSDILVSSQRHQHPHPDAFGRQVGDERPSHRMTARARDARIPVQSPQVLG